MQIEHEVRDFLMSRRARLSPEQAGLPYIAAGGRRVPGLRREEVAMLAGLSVEYYTRLERGRLGGASEGVLDAIAKALQLDEDERTHLYDLARNATASPRKKPVASSPVTASAQQVLQSMSVPAVVQNDRLDILAANDLGLALYGPLFEAFERTPNFARFVFLDSRAATFYPELDDSKNLVVAVLRATAGHNPLDRNLTDLVGELAAQSGDFAKRWAKHDVRRHLRGRKLINHPEVGLLDLTFDDFALPGDAHHSITTYTAEPGTPSADGLALLGTIAASRAAGATSSSEAAEAAAAAAAAAAEDARG